MNPVLAEVLAERFPTPAQVEWEKRRTPAWIDCESNLVKLERRRALVEAMQACPQECPTPYPQNGLNGAVPDATVTR